MFCLSMLHHRSTNYAIVNTRCELLRVQADLGMINKLTRIDVYETLCPQQMLVHKGGKIKNWGGDCRDGVGLEGSGWM